MERRNQQQIDDDHRHDDADMQPQLWPHAQLVEVYGVLGADAEKPQAQQLGEQQQQAAADHQTLHQNGLPPVAFEPLPRLFGRSCHWRFPPGAARFPPRTGQRHIVRNGLRIVCPEGRRLKQKIGAAYKKQAAKTACPDFCLPFSIGGRGADTAVCSGLAALRQRSLYGMSAAWRRTSRGRSFRSRSLAGRGPRNGAFVQSHCDTQQRCFAVIQIRLTRWK